MLWEFLISVFVKASRNFFYYFGWNSFYNFYFCFQIFSSYFNYYFSFIYFWTISFSWAFLRIWVCCYYYFNTIVFRISVIIITIMACVLNLNYLFTISLVILKSFIKVYALDCSTHPFHYLLHWFQFRHRHQFHHQRLHYHHLLPLLHHHPSILLAF